MKALTAERLERLMAAQQARLKELERLERQETAKLLDGMTKAAAKRK